MPPLPASRNPLRTCKLEQLPFLSPGDGCRFDWTGFLAKLHSGPGPRRGAVVGPHGSGKTTFLVELKRRLEARGHRVLLLFTNREIGRRIPAEWIRQLRTADEQTLVLADGYDSLGPCSRWQLRRVLRRHGGLIVTAHRRCALPTLLETHTSTRLLETLVNELYATAPGAVRPNDALLEGLFRSCRGNLREVFRRLYTLP